MTSEEQFLEWWDKIPSTMISRKDQTYKAWLEATRQAYEDCVRICDEIDPDCSSVYVGEIIQARLKELMPQ